MARVKADQVGEQEAAPVFDQDLAIAERVAPSNPVPPVPSIGRIVHYVANPGEVYIMAGNEGGERPAIVVLVRTDFAAGDNAVDLLVFLDGSNDPAFRSGPENSNTYWVAGVKYDANKGARTWHWHSN